MQHELFLQKNKDHRFAQFGTKQATCTSPSANQDVDPPRSDPPHKRSGKP